MAMVVTAQRMQEPTAASHLAPSGRAGVPDHSFAQTLKTMAAAHQTSNGEGKNANQESTIEQKPAACAVLPVVSDATTSSAKVTEASAGKLTVVDGSTVAADAPVENAQPAQVSDTEDAALATAKPKSMAVPLPETVPTKLNDGAMKAKHTKHDAAATGQLAPDSPAQDIATASPVVAGEQGKDAPPPAAGDTAAKAAGPVLAVHGEKTAKSELLAPPSHIDSKTAVASDSSAAPQNPAQPGEPKLDHPAHGEVVGAVPTAAGAELPVHGAKDAGITAPVEVNAGAGAGGPHRAQPSVPTSTATHEAPGSTSSSGDDWTVQSYEAPSSNRLEIGVAGGSWGWLKVRAELVQGGGVHAYLRGATAGAENELRSQATDLQSYLQGQQLSVQSVHVETSRAQGWSGDANSFGGNSAERQGENADGRKSAEQMYGKQTQSLSEAISSTFLPPVSLSGAGGWLNVLA